MNAKSSNKGLITPTQMTIKRLKEKHRKISKNQAASETNLSVLQFIEEELKELESTLVYEAKILEVTFKIGFQNGTSIMKIRKMH